MGKSSLTFLSFIIISSTIYSQNLGFGLSGRLYPKISDNKIFHNKYYETQFYNHISSGLFISYRFSKSSPTIFSLKYSYGQKHLNEPQGYITSSTTKYINFYTIELSILYGIKLAKDLRLKAGIMPGLYYAMLEDKRYTEKKYRGDKFSISPVAALSFTVFEKIDLDFSAIYSIEKIKVPVDEFSSGIPGQWINSNDFDEYDFKGFNFRLEVTYWIDM